YREASKRAGRKSGVSAITFALAGTRGGCAFDARWRIRGFRADRQARFAGKLCEQVELGQRRVGRHAKFGEPACRGGNLTLQGPHRRVVGLQGAVESLAQASEVTREVSEAAMQFLAQFANDRRILRDRGLPPAVGDNLQ